MEYLLWARRANRLPAVALCCRADELNTDKAMADIILNMVSSGLWMIYQIAVLSPSVDETSKLGVGFLRIIWGV